MSAKSHALHFHRHRLMPVAFPFHPIVCPSPVIVRGVCIRRASWRIRCLLPGNPSARLQDESQWSDSCRSIFLIPEFSHLHSPLFLPHRSCEFWKHSDVAQVSFVGDWIMAADYPLTAGGHRCLQSYSRRGQEEDAVATAGLLSWVFRCYCM